MFNLSSCWSRKIPEDEAALVSYLTSSMSQDYSTWNFILINLYAGLPSPFLTSLLRCFLVDTWYMRGVDTHYIYIYAALTHKGNLILIKSFLFFNLEDRDWGHLKIEYSASLFSALLNSFFPLFLSSHWILSLSLSLFLSTRFYSFTDNPNQLWQRTPIHRGQRQIERAPICELWSPISDRNFLQSLST